MHAPELHRSADDLKKRSKVQEVQILFVNGCHIASANGSQETRTLKGLLDKAEERVMGKAVSFATTPEAAYRQATKGNNFVIFEGANQGEGDLHAEQNLLRVINYMLQSNIAIQGEIEIWGQKPPCSKCASVLEAFAEALFLDYGYTLVFDNKKNYQLPEGVERTAPNRVTTTNPRKTDTDTSIPPLVLEQEMPEQGVVGEDNALRYTAFLKNYKTRRPTTVAEKAKSERVEQRFMRLVKKAVAKDQEELSNERKMMVKGLIAYKKNSIKASQNLTANIGIKKSQNTGTKKSQACLYISGLAVVVAGMIIGIGVNYLMSTEGSS